MKNNFAVIFDMDGVIVDSNPSHKIALVQFAKKYGFELSDQELREKVYGRTNKEWITNLFGKLPPEKLNEYVEEKECLYREIYGAKIKPVKGLISFLEKLEEGNIQKAIATSAPPSNVVFTLDNLRIKHFFKVIFDDTRIKNSKPHPEIYQKTCLALGKSPADCVVFEDSISGITAASSAGCKVVGITTTHSRYELQDCDLIIDNFDSLTPESLSNFIFQK